MNTLAVLTSFLFTIVKYNMALLYGTVGEIVTEKSGSLNLGVEGTMAIGAMGGYLIGCAFDNLYAGILFAFLFAALCGLLFAFLTVTLQANQNVTGLTITTFGLGLYFFIGNGFKSAGKWSDLFQKEGLLKGAEPIELPLLSKIPVIGDAFFSQNILVYLGILISVLIWWYLKYTKQGLRLRAVGENPASADAVGVNITLYKYVHIMLGSGIMGIGGLLMCINLSGSFEGQQLLDQRVRMDFDRARDLCKLEHAVCHSGDLYIRLVQYAADLRRFSGRHVSERTGLAQENPAAVYAGASVPHYGRGARHLFRP